MTAFISNFAMHFSWMQETVQEVNKANGFTANDNEVIEKMTEELEELKMSLNGYYFRTNGASEHIATISATAEELADICIVAMFAAAERGIDLGAAIEAKVSYNRGRGYRHGR